MTTAPDRTAAPDTTERRRTTPPHDLPPISVVVTVLNEGSALADLVTNLLAQLDGDDELIIVDGGSTDGSVEALTPKDRTPNPRLRIVHDPGAGISAGRNHGIRVTRNEVVVCTDAGCIPEPDFVDAFRHAFVGEERPVLVAGVYTVVARNALERAQALACYPQPSEVVAPGPFVRLYTRLFGTGYDPRFAVGRCVAFTWLGWARAGGFPEDLATGEDVSFALAVARHGEVRSAPAARVGWIQRDGLAATWRMYRGYGRASTDGGDWRLLVRDGVRGVAYLVVPALLFRRSTRLLAGAGAAAYLSLPVVRAVRARAGVAAVALLPVALATKDLGKLAGAAQGLMRRYRRTR